MLDIIFTLVPIAFIVFMLRVGSHTPDVGGVKLERVSYTPHTESFLTYVPLVSYCLVLPVYYAFRRQRILAAILIALCLIMSLQMLWIRGR